MLHGWVDLHRERDKWVACNMCPQGRSLTASPSPAPSGPSGLAGPPALEGLAIRTQTHLHAAVEREQRVLRLHVVTRLEAARKYLIRQALQ